MNYTFIGLCAVPTYFHTVQTVDLILPRIGRIPQLHSCIEQKFKAEWLRCTVRNFTLAPQGTHDPDIIFLP